MSAARKQEGFTLLELLLAMLVFLLVAGAAFRLLGVSQKRYQTDSQLLTSFQDARLAMDQMTRDINDSGYVPPNHFSVLPAATLYAATPFAWGPGYPNAPCVVGAGGCTNGFDLIIESAIDPLDPVVKWVRYQLPAPGPPNVLPNVLLRGVVPKVAGGDPVAATAAFMVPYLQNVMNNGTPAQIAAINAAYPGTFPGGNPAPIFTYTTFDAPDGAGCTNVASSPCNIRDVEITLIVQAPSLDAQTGQLRLVELHGRGHRINPNN